MIIRPYKSPHVSLSRSYLPILLPSSSVSALCLPACLREPERRRSGLEPARRRWGPLDRQAVASAKLISQDVGPGFPNATRRVWGPRPT
jgi:hypothetical protein